MYRVWMFEPLRTIPAKLYTRRQIWFRQNFGTFLLQHSAMVQGGSPVKHRAPIASFNLVDYEGDSGPQKGKVNSSSYVYRKACIGPKALHESEVCLLLRTLKA